MNILPKYKTGTCSQCGDVDVPCTKVGKELFCTHKCHKNNKAKQQVAKAAERNRVRSLAPRYDENQEKEIKSTMELNRWFIERRKEMKGVCKHCGGKTCMDDESKLINLIRTEQNGFKKSATYKNSVAHILPKALFPSVATHPSNWIELCFWGNSCHTNFDNHMLDIMELNCFDEVIEKFIAMYPSIDEKEKRRIPDVLLQYVKSNT